ncbi:igE-binding protein-like [Nannospalax galili]|uniref:igE-binding protein-like n=1 Tax=Nannospalax galili TaxID=1026970 RepID=UPI00111C6C76|nr:igE-binding protein-like [Nannospalax galili]
MGSTQSLVTALQEVLKQRDIKIAPRTLKNFIKEVDRVAPWYACSGSLTLASWNKLGRDLDLRQEQEDLRLGTKAIWKLIKNCLQDRDCAPMIKEGQRSSENVQEGLSETERGDRVGARKKATKPLAFDAGTPGRGSQISEGTKSERDPPYNPDVGREQDLYPFSMLHAFEECFTKQHEEDGQSSSSEEDPLGDLEASPEFKIPMRATAPPVHSFSGRVRHAAGTSLLPPKVNREITRAFPVFEVTNDQGQANRVYAQVEYSQLKELAEAVRKYGTTANFTLAQLDRLAVNAMTPADWQTVAKATLPNMGQYLEWKALWYEASQEQARVNAIAITPEQQAWTFEMLTGQGAHNNNQNQFPWGIYAQISRLAIKAWKLLSRRGGIDNQLSKILQRNDEPFSEFVARMSEAATRIFGETDQINPLVEQLIFEQANQACRAAIAPRRAKGLTDWVRICRDIGGPLTNEGLAAAILRQQPRTPPVRKGPVCFRCGKTGHLKHDCRVKVTSAQGKTEGNMGAVAPMRQICQRCRKGYHPTEQCRSIKDIDGNLLPINSKNGERGPRTWGPSKVQGLSEIQTKGTRPMVFQKMQEEMEKEDTEWTCVPPPDVY